MGDASYAELFTDYGPAELFISHVWTETAYNTRKALQDLQDVLRERSSWGSCPTSPRASVVSARNARNRVWFCTVANNQSRVAEELGDNIQESPFAQVLGSPTCNG